MKFYSEKLKKFYDSAEACESAEVEAEEREAKTAAEELRRAHELATTKKEMAKAVEDANKAYDDARKNYIQKRNETREKLLEFEQELKLELKEYYSKVCDAEREQNKALLAFNEKFGPFKQVLKINDTAELINNLNNFFRFSWF